jgi:hypothetical protein
VLPALIPNSAIGTLFDRAHVISLQGVQTVKIPTIAAAGRPGAVPSVGEASPINVVNMSTTAPVLGPVKKMALIATITWELDQVSAARAIIEAALRIAATKQLERSLAATRRRAPRPKAFYSA